jgi:cell wall-associated NlpC family hydrolase
MNFIVKAGFIAAVGLISACSSHSSFESQGSMEASFQQGKASKTGQAQIGEGKSIQVSRTTEAANDVLINAMGLVGTPYRWGGDNEREGFDCSGLIRHVFAETLDMNLPRRSADMSVMQGKVVSKDKLKTGDLLFFSTAGKRGGVNHAGIYVGSGRFVHAPRKGRNVSVSSLDAAYWQKTFTVAKRVITPQALDLAKADTQH